MRERTHIPHSLLPELCKIVKDRKFNHSWERRRNKLQLQRFSEPLLVVCVRLLMIVIFIYATGMNGILWLNTNTTLRFYLFSGETLIQTHAIISKPFQESPK